ncbi:ATP-binding cassette domain-containing protein [Nocardioides convexus]|uniref:ATP-binding cassette domain-containing protein n=1 Tax=Nocardioides convexus TaxID=2712224 RepID=UPI002418B4BB|nr:ATP-binding cassette domain-containing protein [Nocardioides convexus]
MRSPDSPRAFGSQNIWSDVTLTLAPGEITALLGPSGTGKSVFLKSLMGLLRPEAGSLPGQRRRHGDGEGVAPPGVCARSSACSSRTARSSDR